MHLQKKKKKTELYLGDSLISEKILQNQRAELTALIGDLGAQQQAFVEKLARAVDEKGQYEVSHSQNTADLSKKLCQQLGLNEKTTDLKLLYNLTMEKYDIKNANLIQQTS